MNRKNTVIAISVILLAVAISVLLTSCSLSSPNLSDETLDGVYTADNMGLSSSANKKTKKLIDEVLTTAHTIYYITPFSIDYPLDGSVFPPDLVAPTILRNDREDEVGAWLVDVTFEGSDGRLCVITASNPLSPPVIDQACIADYNELPKQKTSNNWTPEPALWEAIINESSKTPAWFNLGIMQEKLSDDKSAITSYNKALTYDPNNSWAINRLARVYVLSKNRALRNIPRAVKLAEKACYMSNYREPALLEV
ncbi:tetratricopeptide repeat protein [Candidatus Latescibacterota bacterium]